MADNVNDTNAVSKPRKKRLSKSQRTHVRRMKQEARKSSSLPVTRPKRKIKES
jgi:hypothetical protein